MSSFLLVLLCVWGGEGGLHHFPIYFLFQTSVQCTLYSVRLLVAELTTTVVEGAFICGQFLTFAQLNLVLGPTTLSLASFVMYYKFFC